MESLGLCSICPCLTGVFEMLIASDMSSSSCCLTIPCSCCLMAVAESSMIYSVYRLLRGTFRVFLLLQPPPFMLCSRCFTVLTLRLFPSLGYLSVVLPFCSCFFGFLVHNALTLKLLPCPIRLGACPCSLFRHHEHEISWHMSAGPGAEVCTDFLPAWLPLACQRPTFQLFGAFG